MGVSIPSWIGTLLQLPALSQVNTGTGDWRLVGRTVLIAVAAATPFPSPLALNSEGAVAAIRTVPRVRGPVLFVRESVAFPIAVPAGISKLIWPGDSWA